MTLLPTGIAARSEPVMVQRLGVCVVNCGIMRRRFRGLPLLILSASVACSGGGSPNEGTSAPLAHTSSATGTPTGVASPSPGQLITPNGSPYEIRYTGVQDVRSKRSARLVMSGFKSIEESPYFSPSTLIGSPGERLRLTIVNQSLVPFTHNFTLEEQQINHDIAWKKNYVITVTFPTSGSLFFYCKYHVAIGQVGELVVR